MVPSIETENADPTKRAREANTMGSLAFLLVDKTRGFVEACYERGDLDATLAYLDPSRATCFGYVADLHAFNSDDVARLLEASCAYARRIGSRIVSHECHLTYRNEACAVVLSSLRTRATKGDAADEYVRRLTFVYAPVGDEWLVVHVHSSAPDTPEGEAASRGMTARDVGAVDVDAVLSQAKIERERYEIVSELSDDIIYEYDVVRDTLHLFSTRFGENPNIRRNKVVVEHCKSTLDPSGFVHPDDRERYVADTRLLSQAKPEPGTEHDAYAYVYRLRPVFFFDDCKGDRDTYVHQRVLGRRIYDSEGRLVKYVGKIVDVSGEYELLEQSSTDSLTRAYNRSYLQSRLREYCASKQPDVSYACLLADVDCFKSVNDQFGHLVGDELLTSFADTARALFRTSDVVARLGGDEFMVFMRDVYDPRVAMERSEALIAAFRSAAADRGLPHDVSLSVGVVVSQDPHPFSELYRRADIALYRAKAEGKNCAVAYLEGMAYPEGGCPAKPAPPAFPPPSLGD